MADEKTTKCSGCGREWDRTILDVFWQIPYCEVCNRPLGDTDGRPKDK